MQKPFGKIFILDFSWCVIESLTTISKPKLTWALHSDTLPVMMKWQKKLKVYVWKLCYLQIYIGFKLYKILPNCHPRGDLMRHPSFNSLKFWKQLEWINIKSASKCGLNPWFRCLRERFLLKISLVSNFFKKKSIFWNNLNISKWNNTYLYLYEITCKHSNFIFERTQSF